MSSLSEVLVNEVYGGVVYCRYSKLLSLLLVAVMAILDVNFTISEMNYNPKWRAHL